MGSRSTNASFGPGDGSVWGADVEVQPTKALNRFLGEVWVNERG
jgi:hypothetical protein